ncbi:MAG TPA: efflux transporter outer membrane subunit [Steroidobacteraceae bacterium]|nr:efflux transporter outer membrane subunit [Steroidobacteraceae bacterium]
MRVFSIHLVIGCALAISCLAGCSVPARNERRPRIVVPGPQRPRNEPRPSAWPSATWWRSFRDPTLDALIQRAFGSQPTLRIAQARVALARGAAVAAGAPLRPAVVGSGGVSRKGISSGALVPAPLAGKTVNYGSLALALEYDFDFWGRNHALLRAAQDEVAVADAEDAGARLILATAVTATYFDLRYALEQSDLADQTVDRRGRILSLVSDRERIGLDQLAAVRQAEAEVASARVLAIQARNRTRILRDALAALTGQAPDATASLGQPLAHALPALQLPQLVPADLIGRRPDLAALRKQVSAATERTRAAKADFFPNINLASFLGLEHHDLPELLEGASRTWGVGLALDLPIFDGGVRRGHLEVRRSQADIAIEEYNSLLLQAIQQAADAIASYQSAGSALVPAQQAVQATRSAYELILARYRRGLVSYIDVLTVENALLARQSTLVRILAQQTTSAVALIKALGGGYTGEGVVRAAPTARRIDPNRGLEVFS